MDSRNEMDMAKAAYDAYKESVGGTAFNGDQLPEFSGLNLKITTAWLAAARAVATAVRSERNG
jgi:hypothetical protein